MDKLYILVIWSTLVNLAYMGSPCPNAANIIPCKCSKMGLQTIVECSYPDTSLLRASLQSMSSGKMIVDQIYINNSLLTSTDSTFFGKMTVREMSFHASRWNTIEKDTFKDQVNSLEVLIIDQSSLVRLPIDSVENLLYLSKLQVIKSEITGIEENVFENMKSASNLNHLDLSFNYIRFIGDGAFTKLTNLRHLRLAGNRIRSLPSAFLPISSKIKEFSMQDNQLQSLSGEIEPLPSDSKLNFANNRIVSITGNLLKTMIVNSYNVNLKGNPLDCSCDFKIMTIFKDMNSIYGVCQQPAELFNKTLSSLTANDFNSCYAKK